MTTPCSGCITLDDVRKELKLDSLNCFSLGSAESRELAGRKNSTDCISLSELYCKAPAICGRFQQVITQLSGQDVAYGNGILVFIDEVGRIFSSSDEGITWTVRSATGTTVPTFFTSDIQFANGLFVATSGNENIRTSVDGITWTSRNANLPGTTSDLREVRFANGLWVAVGEAGAITTSPTGTTWTLRASGTTKNLFDLEYANGVWIAVGDDGTVKRSVDGITWTNGTILPSGLPDFTYLAFGGGVWVASTRFGDLWSSTDNGLNWNQTGLVNTEISDLQFLNGRWFAGGVANKAVTSTDGLNWTRIDSSFTVPDRNLSGFAYGKGEWLAFAGAQNGVGSIYSSTDGVNWTLENQGCDLYLGTRTFAGEAILVNGKWLIVTENGIIREI